MALHPQQDLPPAPTSPLLTGEPEYTFLSEGNIVKAIRYDNTLIGEEDTDFLRLFQRVYGDSGNRRTPEEISAELAIKISGGVYSCNKILPSVKLDGPRKFIKMDLTDATLVAQIFRGGAPFLYLYDVGLKLVNGTLDMNKLQGAAIGGNGFATRVAPKYVSCIGTRFLNTYSFGINVGGLPDGSAQSELYLENCHYNAGPTESLNEHITANAFKKVTIKNCDATGNKTCFITADTVEIDGLTDDSANLQVVSSKNVNTRRGVFRNMTSAGANFKIRPYLSIHWKFGYSNAEYIELSNFNFTSRANRANSPLILEGYDDQFFFQKVVFDGIHLSDNAVLAQPHFIRKGVRSRIAELTLKDVTIDTIGLNKMLTVSGTTIDKLTVINPPGNITTPSNENLLRLLPGGQVLQMEVR